jgi:hypothetical protein
MKLIFHVHCDFLLCPYNTIHLILIVQLMRGRLYYKDIKENHNVHVYEINISCTL